MKTIREFRLASAVALLSETGVELTGDEASRLCLEINNLEAEKAELRKTIQQWQDVGDVIMECVTGKVAQLSDSDVCGEFAALRERIAELEAQLHPVGCQDVKEYYEWTCEYCGAKLSIDYETCPCRGGFGGDGAA